MSILKQELFLIAQVHVKSTLYNVKYNGSFNYHKIIITYLFLLLCTYFKCKVDLLFIAVDVLMQHTACFIVCMLTGKLSFQPYLLTTTCTLELFKSISVWTTFNGVQSLYIINVQFQILLLIIYKELLSSLLQAPIIYKLIHELLCLNIAVHPNLSSASLTDCLLVEKRVQTFQTKVCENCCPNPCQSVIPCLQ